MAISRSYPSHLDKFCERKNSFPSFFSCLFEKTQIFIVCIFLLFTSFSFFHKDITSFHSHLPRYLLGYPRGYPHSYPPGNLPCLSNASQFDYPVSLSYLMEMFSVNKFGHLFEETEVGRRVMKRKEAYNVGLY